MFSIIKYLSMLYIFACLSISCSTASLQIQTEPSDSSVTSIENGVEKKLGVSPLSYDKNNYPFQDQKLIRLVVEKPGYLKEQIVIENEYFMKTGHINVKLTPIANWKEATQDPQANKYLNDVASMAAEIQAMTVKKDFAGAEALTKSLISRYPKLSVGYILMGNIYYLQRRVGDATQAYAKALDLNPGHQETKSILDRLKGQTF
ncbi:MAG: tetratricopeptide repeat protein [Bdellovibrionales bacterium]|nr:tetratricopeptide repeat protein [Bdellovibrionales bacterium]